MYAFLTMQCNVEFIYVSICVSLGTPPAATVVIVMCIAALVVIVVLGIYRIHTTHQDGSKEDEEGRKDPEMDWDDSNLNITVNPMEVSMCLIAKDKYRGSNFSRSLKQLNYSQDTVKTNENVIEVN